MKKALIIGILLPVAGLGAGLSFAPPPETMSHVRVVHSRGRFVVSGGAPHENVEFARALDDVWERLELFMGVQIPVRAESPVRFSLTRASGQDARINVEQGWADGQLVQRVRITNVEKLDQEDLLEVVSSVFLSRVSIYRQAVEERAKKLAEVPDWLAVGAAQNLFVTLRKRNAEILYEYWQQGHRIGPDEILALKKIPLGRWGEKAAAGMWVGLLMANAERGALLDCLFECIRRDKSMSLGQLSACDPLRRSPIDWEKEWDVWVLGQGQSLRVLGQEGRREVEALRAEVMTTPAMVSMILGTAEVPDLAGLDLVPLRYEPWMTTFAQFVAFRVRAIGIGLTREFWEVTDAYARFFEELAKCPRQNFFARHFFKGRSYARARQLWRLAEERLQKYEERTADGETATINIGSAVEMRRFVSREERIRWQTNP